jgi:hypothetical protein
MKIIQSFWTLPMFKGDQTIHNNRLSGGWINSKYNLLSWAYSCLQLRKFYHNVELITDQIGKILLIDCMQLPYTKVSTDLDVLGNENPELWAIGKLTSMQLQEEPFIHVDGDVFIWERFSEKLEEASVVVQNREADFTFYRTVLDHLISNNLYVPAVVQKNYLTGEKIDAFNAGIVGGNDVIFFKNYISEALRFGRNAGKTLERFSSGMFNAVYEQHLLYCLTQEKSKHVECLTTCTDKRVINEMFKGYSTFCQAPGSSKYIHLFGEDAKKNIAICHELERRVRTEYRSCYRRIADLSSNIENASVGLGLAVTDPKLD